MKALVAANNHSGQSDELIIAIAYAESRFHPNAQNSRTTAGGLLGLTDGAIADLEARHEGPTHVDKYDPAQDIDAGSRYLALRIQRADGNVSRALAGYGPSPAYAAKVINAANALHADPPGPMQPAKTIPRQTMIAFFPRTTGRTLVLAALVLAFSFHAKAGTLVGRLTALVQGMTYRLDIQDQWETAPLPLPPQYHDMQPAKMLIRVLTIHCIANCKYAASYQEDVDDSPIAAFRLWDGSPDLITIWSGGSAYRVRIYHVGEHGIEKVLEKGTKSAPQFGVAADGSTVVVLDDPYSPAPRGSFHANGIIWTWDGQRYQPAAGTTHG